MKYFIVILLSFLAISVNLSTPTCGYNEIWKFCGSKCKALTCKNLYSDSVIDCPNDVCDSGCFCNKRFARNDDNVCVPVAECAREYD